MLKNIFLRIVALLVCLILILSGCGGEKTKDIVPAATTALDFVEERDLYLYLKKATFIVGEQAQFEMTVLVGEALSGDITIQNEAGKIIAAIKNDGSGMLHATARVDTSTIGSGALTASVGSTISRSIRYTVQPEVTEAMMENLIETAGDVAGVAHEAGFEDIYCEEALAAVQKYLENDPRIKQVRLESDGVYYLTQDSLLGFYGKTTSEDYAGVSAGFEEPDNVFEAWLNNEDVSDSYLESEIPITNDQVLFMTPEFRNDDIMNEHTSMTGYAFGSAWTAAGGPEIEYAFNRSATRMLLDANYTNYGFVMLGAHGSYKECSSGRNMLFIRAAYGTKEEIPALLADIEESFPSYWHEDLENFDNARACMASAWEDSKIVYYLRFSGQLLEEALSDKIFDNTVLYMFVCYGFQDEQLIQAFLDHGASIVIGCASPFKSFYSAMAIQELSDSIRTTKKGEKCITIPEAIVKMDRDTAKRLIKEYFRVTDEQLKNDSNVINREKELYTDGYVFAIENKRYITYKAGNVHKVSRVLYGYGDAKGNVLQEMEDGTKIYIEGAEVTLYRWLNHNFEEYEDAVAITDANGDYKFEDVPCGIYGVKAEKDGDEAWTTCEIGDDSTEIDPICLLVELSGRVLDESTAQPIEGARVTLESEGKNNPVSQIAVTDAEGKWSMVVSPAAYRVLFEKNGYYNRTSVIKRDWLKHGPYRFDVHLQPVHALVVTTQPQEECGDEHTQLILRPLILSAPIDENKITGPLEGVFAEAERIFMDESMESYVTAVPNQIYANSNVISVQTRSYFFTGGAHGLQGTKSIMLDAETGEKLQLHDLLDKDSPDAEARLRSWLREELSYLKDSLFTTLDELIDSILRGDCGRWCLTREGLQLALDPAEVATWAAGASYPTLPFSQMSGIVDEKYLPVGIVGDGKASVEKLNDGDERMSTHTLLGNGHYALVVDGEVSNFEVRLISDAEIRRGIVFYAELLNDAVVLLPVVDDPRFEVCWESGGKSNVMQFDFN